MNPKEIKIIAILFITAFLMGCSGKATSPLESVNIDSPFPLLGVSDWNADSSPQGGMGALGLFNVSIDPVNMKGEFASIRTGSSTDVLEVVDITNFMALAPCSNCVKLKSIGLDSNGNVVVSIGIKHPFPTGDPAKPISGRNRADLHVFNVEGIVISNAPGTSFPQTGQTISGVRLLSADGYTGYLDEPIDSFHPTDATIHPYLLHFDDYSTGNYDPSNPKGFASVTDPPPSGNLVMAMGCDYNYRDYVFDIDDSFDFVYAVGCTYALSAIAKSQRFNPEYRVPQHNKKAASEVSIDITRNELRGGVASSSADVEIHVVDISHGVPMGSALNQMMSDSSVKNVHVEIPGITTSPVVVDGASPISGTGHDPSDPLVYTALVANSASGGEGTYAGLVKVLDSYAPGQNSAPMLQGMDGIQRVEPGTIPTSGLFQIAEFATYQVFEITVSQSCGPITGSIISPACPLDLVNGSTQNFTVQASSANGGNPIVLYEADYDFDGVTFNPFSSNTNGVFSNLGPFKVSDPCPDNVPYTFHVAFRATDSCPTPNKTIFATCEVTVRDCFGNLTITTNRIPVTNGFAFDPAGPWTLHWDTKPGAVEYAVYYDTDPSDGLTNNLLYVGVSTSLSYKVPPGHLPADRYVIGYTYVVRPRSQAGDPLSEMGTSEPAHIMTNGWETLPLSSIAGEGWVGNHESSNTSSFTFPETNNYWPVGAVTLRFSPHCGAGFYQTWAGRWNGMTKQTPSVPNAPVRWLECSSFYYGGNSPNGLIFGTCSVQPTLNWTIPTELEWASVASTGGFTGYNSISQDVASTFDGAPSTVNNAWIQPDWPAVNFVFGGDVNMDGNSNDQYVAMEYVRLQDVQFPQPYPYVDDIAIMLY